MRWLACIVCLVPVALASCGGGLGSEGPCDLYLACLKSVDSAEYTQAKSQFDGAACTASSSARAACDASCQSGLAALNSTGATCATMSSTKHGDAGSDAAGMSGGMSPSDAATSGGGSDDAATSGETYSGQATYYDADGTGSCNFAASSDFDVCALNNVQYEMSWCGQCIHVVGPDGQITVRIVDRCPGCANGGLDLSETAFAAIAPLEAGRVDVTWSVVDCPN